MDKGFWNNVFAAFLMVGAVATILNLYNAETVLGVVAWLILLFVQFLFIICALKEQHWYN